MSSADHTIRSRQYSWSPAQRVIAKSRARIAEILDAGLPADVTAILVEARMRLATADLAMMRAYGDGADTVTRPILTPRARTGSIPTAVAA